METKYSPLAVAGGILGLLSLFLGMFSAIPSLILSIAGFSQIRSKETYKGNGLCVFGIVTSVITIIFYVVGKSS
jgi:hypothetical protein